MVCGRCTSSNIDGVSHVTVAAGGGGNDEAVVIAKTSVNVTSVNSGRLPVPYKFPVQNVRPGLLTAISSGQSLRTKERTELLEAIYVDVTKYRLYVSSLLHLHI